MIIMLKQFNLGFENHGIGSEGIIAIKYNLQQKLSRLPYLSYTKISISITDYNKEKDLGLWWDDKKTANLRCYIDGEIIKDLSNSVNIALTYQEVLLCLEQLWVKNNWNKIDLTGVYETLEKENFHVLVSMRKKMQSENKKFSVDFNCIIFPTYTDFYLIFSRRNQIIRRIKFLKGQPDPFIFFGFFTNRYWKGDELFLISDINKEIFFIFSIDKDDFSIEYRPLINSLEKCKDYLRAFEAGLSHKERMRLLGLPS